MRALTLRPWWAHAIAHMGKRCENRSQPIPRALIGQRIAIHAGATPHWPALTWHVESMRWERAVTDAGHEPGALEGMKVVTRHIVATAVLGGEWRDRVDETLFPAWAEAGMHWWALDDVRTLVTPVPVPRGQLGLWRLPPEVGALVREREREATRG